ncbi:NADP-dependent phosphogluconate dehydrogenase [Pseudocnuella soli]|uniref:NADP-dependent phosphogluconate dehydrogenase n=1 Tax=Pseudocnuella soli TaxID=2502779 RepID=UPI00195CA1B5|nr:NADP-dependent phosphogluconate dehydrogenase [Pseudocnuella soli]
MTPQFDFGMIGLGVMGSNLLLNLADNGFATTGYDLNPERMQALETAARPGTTVKGAASMEEMVLSLKKPRKLMMLVPAGNPVDSAINSLLPHLESGDILIDGGNSFYRDTLRRVAQLHEQGIHFFGMGISGGELGARLGPSMMPGGDREAYQFLKPLLEAVAAEADGKPCVAFMGKGAAGHYVKMVHNGIEYAMMQMISEVYDILHRGAGYTAEQLQALFQKWNDGPLQSFLIEITADVFRFRDTETKAWLVDMILDEAGSKGTGRWTTQEALNLPVAIPAIDAAVAARTLSGVRGQRQEAAKLFGQKTAAVNKAAALEAELESALFTGFICAYAQGLSMLAAASHEEGMDIPLPAVVQVWKGGCIIRSALLKQLEQAFAQNETLPNILLDKTVAGLVQEHESGLRNVLTQAIAAAVPVPALSASLAYLDSYRSERLPTNLVQAQRDYFGAHTYKRTDREGVFHTEWHEGPDEQPEP